MKKKVISLLILGVLLVPVSVLAQEQAQTYSGFDRFIDNVKMFFSVGDKKVILSLNIREKELNSAIINTKNGDKEEAGKNLERAKERLQFVQNKVSKDIAEDVKINVGKTINQINGEENLPDNFKTYILEEEKTQLTAELVIELEGKEGQTLTREIVKDGESGKNRVKIEVMGDNGQIKVKEIEGKIGELDNRITERTFAPGTEGVGEPGSDIKTVIVEEGKDGSGDGGLKPEIKTDVGSGSNERNYDLKNEVKTHTAGDGTEMNDPLPEPDLDKINPDLYDPNARAPGDTFVDCASYDDNKEECNNHGECTWVESGFCASSGDAICGNGICEPSEDENNCCEDCREGGCNIVDDNIIEGNNVVDVVDNQIDTPQKTKDNEDVTPEPNIVDDTVDPGPEGIVGSG